mmetsp:Transcript_88017/g.146381  ORF Transcript_88017/g.146381 Transcript_88017/m.146381 type:complete len:95 (+) Transcript_88017:188-472(+)
MGDRSMCTPPLGHWATAAQVLFQNQACPRPTTESLSNFSIAKTYACMLRIYEAHKSEPNKRIDVCGQEKHPPYPFSKQSPIQAGCACGAPIYGG